MYLGSQPDDLRHAAQPAQRVVRRIQPARHRRRQADDDRPGQQGHSDVARLADRHRAAGDRGELLFAGAAEASGGSDGEVIGDAKN